MKVLITGANGFLGRNLAAHIVERQDVEVSSFTKEDSLNLLAGLVGQADFIFHLAGINRPKDSVDFAIGNTGLTEQICELIRESKRKVPVVFASSIQAELDNPYGTSKLAAEQALVELEKETGSPVYIYLACPMCLVNGADQIIILWLLRFATVLPTICQSKLTIPMRWYLWSTWMT